MWTIGYDQFYFLIDVVTQFRSFLGIDLWNAAPPPQNKTLYQDADNLAQIGMFAFFIFGLNL